MTAKTFLFTREHAQRLIRPTVTLVAVVAAVWAGRALWDHYELSPWTRDGRVRVNVVQLAPDVAGLITAVPVHDNQAVKAGELLFAVDHARYALALREAEAALAARQATLAQARRERDRNSGLGALVSQEQQEQARTRVEEATLAVAQAQVAVEAARLNLQRAEVRAPVDGTVTNLDIRVGAYAATGHPALSLVDSHSYYVEGYFEETKLPRIHLGEAVRVTPMGGGQPLRGTVESIAAAIADHDRATGADGLPAVNPNFNWVRLAQRVPVRVRLDTPWPAGTRLVAGQTVTVQVIEPGQTLPGAAPPAPAASATHTALAMPGHGRTAE